MDVSPENWHRVSKLLDEVFDLDPADRATWLERVTVRHPDLAPLVRKLLAAHGAAGHADLLAHLPALALAGNAAVNVSGLAVGALVGPYRLKREIGSGGMADLWLAERADGAFEREVALKLPRLTHLRRDLAERFAHERDILARLEHPYIARFYDAGITDAGLPFLAMEYVDGRPITQWCDEHMLDVAGRLQLLLQVLDAVQFAHRNLVIHRDLKPSNILVTRSGQVRLLDFGIAKLLDGSVATETHLTQVSGRVLTPQYASPEQIRGDTLTTASDVYSVGVVLYELLAGQMPYRLATSSAAQLEEAIVSAVPIRPSVAASDTHAQFCGLSERRLRRALSGDLDTIVLKALAKEPLRRYGSATDLALDLQRHLSGEPVHARPPSWRYRARTFVRRNRLAVAAASAIALTLVAGASVSIWQAQRARAQAARAEEVKDFVLSIFADADTSNGGSRSTTAVDLLRQARHRLESAPVTDPNISAELLNVVGYSLEGLDEYTEALPVLERAVQIADTRLGPDHATTISSRINLCDAYLGVGEQIQKAHSTIVQALASARRNGDAKLLVEALRFRGSVAKDEGNMDAALEYTKESAQLADAKLSHDTHGVARALAIRGNSVATAFQGSRRGDATYVRSRPEILEGPLQSGSARSALVLRRRACGPAGRCAERTR
jgi:serine/threonine-protein kinase